MKEDMLKYLNEAMTPLLSSKEGASTLLRAAVSSLRESPDVALFPSVAACFERIYQAAVVHGLDAQGLRILIDKAGIAAPMLFHGAA